MPKNKCDILIIGAGVPGMALALLLADAGLDIHIVNPHDYPKPKDVTPNGRTVALMNSSLNVLKATGLQNIESCGAKLEAMRIIDDSIPGKESVWADFPANDIGLKQFGFNIPNDILNALLFENVKKHKQIQCHIPSKVEDFDSENKYITARLENGVPIQTDLIVGADGRNSLVRKRTGIECWTKTYDQSAITCLINHSRSHNHIATEFHRENGPLALVPMEGNPIGTNPISTNQSAIVWVEDSQRAEELLRLKKQEFTDTLQAATKDLLGGITLETGPESWPLKTLKAKSLVAPRTALIAEAAHVLSPITAQGLNLSLRDVASLAETIIDAARCGLDYGEASILKKYEKRRQADLNIRVHGVHQMMGIVSTDIMPVKTLRRTGFKILDQFMPMKSIATQQALAPNLDEGRLTSGKAL